MPNKNIVTETELEEIITEAEENDRDLNAIRDMYITPEDAAGAIVKLHQHWGHTFCEVTNIDMGEETVEYEELFTGREFTTSTDQALDIPFIGDEFNISWIEARIDGEWERVSDYSTPDNPQRPYVKSGESYDEMRVVEKSYEYGSGEFDSWPIRIDRQTGEPTVVIDHDDVLNNDVLEKILDNVVQPDDFDLGGLVVGTVYTEDHIVEGDDGQKERKRKLVWWNVDRRFDRSRRGNGFGRRSVSPSHVLDRSIIVTS